MHLIPDHLGQTLARAIAHELRDASNATGYAEPAPSVVQVANLRDAYELAQLPVIRNHPAVKAAILYAAPELAKFNERA